VVNGADTPSPANLKKGDTVRVKLVSSPSYDTKLTAALKLGPRRREFLVTTGPFPWQTKTPMPAARWGLTSAVVDGKIYVMGGYSSGYLNTVEEYWPAVDY
jgi:hypothetical protein